MQVHQLAEVGEANTFAVTRDLLEDGEGAAERLDADPLAVIGVVVDVGLRRLHQLGDGGLARTGRLLAGLWCCTRSHRISLHATVPNCIRPSRALDSAMRRSHRCRWRAHHWHSRIFPSLPQYKLTYSIMGNRVPRAQAVSAAKMAAPISLTQKYH